PCRPASRTRASSPTTSSAWSASPRGGSRRPQEPHNRPQVPPRIHTATPLPFRTSSAGRRPTRGQKGDIKRAPLLGFPTALGLPRLVSEDGPAAVRRVGLVEALAHVLDVTDLGDLAVERPQPGDGVDRLLGQVMAAAGQQAEAFTDAYDDGALAITV